MIILDGWLSVGFCDMLAEGLKRNLHKATRLERERKKDSKTLDGGGLYNHYIFDSLALAEISSAWESQYSRALEEAVVPKYPTAIESPYVRSKFSAKVYPEGGEQGWHYDSNPITFLLYLSEGEGGETEFMPGPQTFTLVPKKGRAVMFEGRTLWHRSKPTKSEKISCSWNFYRTGDVWRPEGMDELVYGA